MRLRGAIGPGSERLHVNHARPGRDHRVAADRVLPADGEGDSDYSEDYPEDDEARARLAVLYELGGLDDTGLPAVLDDAGDAGQAQPARAGGDEPLVPHARRRARARAPLSGGGTRGLRRRGRMTRG